MHVARVVRKYMTREGPRESVSHLIRRSLRVEGKIRHETLGNVSYLPEPALAALRAALAGRTLLVAGDDFRVTRSRPHGHLGAAAVMANTLGLPGLLGPPGPHRDVAYALILARCVHPASKLATTRWWADTTLAADLTLGAVGTDAVYAGMDWLGGRQEAIEAALARRHLAPSANPGGLAYFDLSSSWLEGSHCPLAARGYSRDGKKGKTQIEYGLLTDPGGRPVAIRVLPGNTADPAAFIDIVEVVRSRFGLHRLVMVGDRGMITSARIEALKELGGLGWLTALRAPAIAKLAAEDGPLQLTLFDTTDLAEFTHPDYPGERLVACRNPHLAAERSRKRAELLAATETALAPILAAVTDGRLTGAANIALRTGRIIDKFKMAKHLQLDITDTTLTATRRETQIAAEAALDGIYVLRTNQPPDALETTAVVGAYKQLSAVERDFRSLKAIDCDLRPIHHWTQTRVRAHVLICMLAAYLTWHLRAALAPLTYTDIQPAPRANPVAPARRSAAADRKASTHTTSDGLPAHSYPALLTHLATLTRNQITAGTATFEMLTEPTDVQRRAFELLQTPIPLHLK